MHRYVFNLYPAPDRHGEEITYLYGSDPVVELVERSVSDRTPAQRDALRGRRLGDQDALFGDALDWRYREYVVRRLWASEQSDAPLGNEPEEVRLLDARGGEARAAAERLERARAMEITDEEPRLYLFNVIVALEWMPADDYMQRLRWAFRRASDLLNDATNGCMAFGQVVFGDADWMDCADIQILASNRLLPRSWVGGLLDPDKYTPIRVGRGLWSREGQIAIPWNEPDAYGALVHEWAHYALNQRDAYLSTRPGREIFKGKASEQQDRFTVVVPERNYRSNSIMATPQGNSKLDNPLYIEAERRYYPRLNMPRRVSPGPGGLPLPLPRFRRDGKLAAPSVAEGQGEELTLTVPSIIRRDRCWVYIMRPGEGGAVERIIAQGTLDARTYDDGFRLLGARQGDTVLLIDESDYTAVKVWSALIESAPTMTFAHIRDWYNRDVQRWLDSWSASDVQIQTDMHLRVPESLLSVQSPRTPSQRWSVVLWRRGEDGSHELVGSDRIIHGAPSSLALPGARIGDIVELRSDGERVWRGLIDRADQERTAIVGGWTDVTPRDYPLLYVQPGQVPDGRRHAKEGPIRPAEIVVHLVHPDTDVSDGHVAVFPCDRSAEPGYVAKIQGREFVDVATLDGHVKVTLGRACVVCTYSQGGNPTSAPNVTTSPITAGSADGDALLFFDASGDRSSKDPWDYARCRVITTSLPGSWSDPDGMVPCSNLISIASNMPWPPDLHPTLVILYDPATLDDVSDLHVCRLKLDRPSLRWIRLPTYRQPGLPFVATPLAAPSDDDGPSGGALVDNNGAAGPFVAYFRLYAPAATL